MPGTSALFKRGSAGTDRRILFNSHRSAKADGKGEDVEISTLAGMKLFDAANSIRQWPNHNLFTK
jgi:hypothetical protein